jgi:endo-1,4-beta-xylanase
MADKLLMIKLRFLLVCIITPSILTLNCKAQTSFSKTLKSCYQPYFPIGTAVDAHRDIDNSERAGFLVKQYSSLTAENDMKPAALQPVENQFKWANADKIVNFAVGNNMKVRGHTLVFWSRMPKWFLSNNGAPVSKELLLKRLNAHIAAVVGRYKGKIYCWDVVNEAVSGNGGETFRSNDQLYQIAGEDYVAQAFTYAHQADPSAKLFLNETNFQNETKRNNIYALVKRLKARGVPIDGIGMQFHLGIDGFPYEDLQKSIDMFSSLGLELQISEMDVSIYNKKAKASDMQFQSDNYSAAIQSKQAEIYSNIFQICRRNKGKITGITLWAPADGVNFLTKELGKRNYPYLFNENLQPKPLFNKLVNF